MFLGVPPSLVKSSGVRQSKILKTGTSVSLIEYISICKLTLSRLRMRYLDAQLQFVLSVLNVGDSKNQTGGMFSLLQVHYLVKYLRLICLDVLVHTVLGFIRNF